MSDRLTYSFGPLERRGIAGGIAAGQLAVLGAGALLAILVLDHAPSAGGAMLATIIFAVAGTTAFAPLGGRTVQEWLPIAARFIVAKMLGDGRFVTTEPTAGTVAGTGAGNQAGTAPGRAQTAGAADRRRAARRRGERTPRASTGSAPASASRGGDGPDLRTPPQLRGVEVLEAAYRDQPIGVLAERSGRLATAVLACRVGSFSLLDHEAQERRLARWGLVLSGAGGGPIRRLQWIERTAPAQGDQLARWVHEERDPSIPPRGTAMIESYLELISTSTKVAQEHEVLLAVQVDGRRGRERRRGPAVQTLLEQTERVAQGLEAAEVTVLGALTPAQLARTLRTAFDPYARAELTALHAADPDGGDPASSSWPVGAREAWDHYESDGAMHATYWISAWPRVEVSPMFMDSLLGHSSAVRTVSVTFEPLSIDRSTREIEAAVTRDRADRELRARFGQSETARQRQVGRGDQAPRGGAGRRSRRGPLERLHHGLRTRLRGTAARLRRGDGARRAGATRVAPAVRTAGRGADVHAAAVPGAAMTLRAVERPGHRCTTRHAQAIYPFVNADGLGGRGVFVGRDSTGGAFCFDPWVLYADAVLDDPNAIVLGKLGQGKSSLVKTLLWRMMLFGRRAFVLDVKREYGPLCRAVGVRPISLVPGGSVRLNPLASRPEEHAQLELLRAVTVTALGGPLTQLEAGGLREALRVVRARGAGEPTLPEIAEVLFSPVAEMAQRLQTTQDALAARRPPGRAGAPGSVRGPAAGDVRRPHDARAWRSTRSCWCWTCTRSAIHRRSGS